MPLAKWVWMISCKMNCSFFYVLFFGWVPIRLVAVALRQAGGRRMSLGPLCVPRWSCSTGQFSPQSTGFVSLLLSLGRTLSLSPLPYRPLPRRNVKRVIAQQAQVRNVFQWPGIVLRYINNHVRWKGSEKESWQLLLKMGCLPVFQR